MNSITINGNKISVVGNNVSIANGKVFIDGKEQGSEDSKVINISIEGDVGNLDVDYCQKIDISGSVKKATTQSGDISVSGNVSEGVNSTSGDIEIDGDVEGDIKTVSGDVRCGSVGGSVRTVSGDVKNKK